MSRCIYSVRGSCWPGSVTTLALVSRLQSHSEDCTGNTLEATLPHALGLQDSCPLSVPNGDTPHSLASARPRHLTQTLG